MTIILTTPRLNSIFGEESPGVPADFKPSERVVIGKGKKFYFHPGNQWLRDVVACHIDAYSAATSKTQKSCIISNVVDFVHQNGRFVKLNNDGEWVDAEPLLCREKCSQTFRDYLVKTYRSSRAAKRNRKREVKDTTRNARRVCTCFALDQFSQQPQPDQTVSFCGSWFDWEQPLSNLELNSIHQGLEKTISEDFDEGLFREDEIDPVQLPVPNLVGSSSRLLPSCDAELESFNDSLGPSSPHRLTAAFAA